MTRVEATIGFSKIASRNSSVSLRRVQRGVPEELLHLPYISSMVKQMRRERMSHLMRRDTAEACAVGCKSKHSKDYI